MKIVPVFFLFTYFLGIEQDSNKILTANEAYNAGKYTEAIELYQQILQNDLGGFGLYSNMARSYAMTNQDNHAILYFEKALKLKPNDTNVQADIKKIRQRNTQIEQNNISYFENSWIKFTGIFSPNVWGYISICIFIIFVISLFLYKRIEQKYKYPQLFTASIVLLFFVIVIITKSRYTQVYDGNYLIIMEQNTKLKKGPDSLSPDIDTMVPGTKVSKQDQLNDWVQIKDTYGNIGWVDVKNVASI